VAWLKEVLPSLWSKTWEDLCRVSIPHLSVYLNNEIFEIGKRFWHGNGPEWDVVASSFDRKAILLGEAKWSEKIPSASDLESLLHQLIAKGTSVPFQESTTFYYAIFVPEKPKEKINLPKNTFVLDAKEVIWGSVPKWRKGGTGFIFSYSCSYFRS
jgi:hypothetical protein